MAESELLWHYTTPAGLLGILTTKSLWATSITDMNDSKEGIHGIQLATSHLRKSARQAPSERRKLLEDLGNKLGSPVDKGRFLFATSFTANGDQLSQWRGYASAGGYSIGFEKHPLTKLLQENNFSFGKCLYTDEEQGAKVALHLNEFLTQLDNKNISDFGEATTLLYEHILKLRAELKHHSFSEEDEWRAYKHENLNSEKVMWRVKGQHLIPYISLLLESSAQPKIIRKIVVGPGMDFDRSQNSLIRLCISKNIRGVDILRSRCPYRDS